MSTLRDIYNQIDAIAPFDTQCDWDNSGLQWGDWGATVTKVLLALDLTPAVLEEAQTLGASLVITHHPVIFTPLKQLASGSLPYEAIRRGIGVIAAHTNWDAAPRGVNDALAQALGLTDCRPLEIQKTTFSRKIIVTVPVDHAQAVFAAMAQAGAGRQGFYEGCAFMSRGDGYFTPLPGSCPHMGRHGQPEQMAETRIEMMVAPADIGRVVAALKAAHPYEKPAYDIFANEAESHITAIGLTGQLPQAYTADGFAAFVKQALDCPGLRYVPSHRPIQRVSVCGGAGGHTLSLAAAQGADALVTGDVKHNFLLEAAARDICLVDAGHFATENPAMPRLQGELAPRLPDVTFCLSQSARALEVYLV